MKPLVIIALTTAGLVGTSSMAGERPSSFDGVGSMVLDMADEPVQASYEETETDTDTQECEAKKEAFEAQVEALYEDIHDKIALSEKAFAAVDYSELAKIGDAIAAEVAELPMTFSQAYAENEATFIAARETAVSSAQAAIEERREELKARIASVSSHQSRMALERAEKALRIAQEALMK